MNEPLNFPRLNINTAELVAVVEALLKEARLYGDEMGAVNWGDLGVADVEYRLSMLHPQDGPSCVVLVEEASPSSNLAPWLNSRLDVTRFPQTWVVCEW